MALTQISTDGISDDAVTTDKLANAINTARDANTAKTTNATHSGEVTGATALTIADNVVDEANLKVSNSPTNGYFLSAQSGNTGGLTWAAVNTDLVNDTSPQLGGDLATNSNNISFADNDRARFGNGNDLDIYHDGTDNNIYDAGSGSLRISKVTGAIKLRVNNSENAVVCNQNGAVELYHDNIKRFETDTDGVRVVAPEGGQAMLRLIGDEGDDNNDYFRLNAGGGTLKLQDASNGSSWEDNIVINAAGSVELYHDNSKKLETYSAGIEFHGNLKNETDGTANGIYLGASNDLQLYHDSNTFVRNNNNSVNLILQSDYITLRGNSTSESYIKCVKDAQVELYYDNAKKLETTTHGIKLGGANTVADSSADDLQIGLGTGHHGMTIYSGTSHVGAIYFADGSSGSSQYRGYCQYEHNYDRFIWGTAGATRLILDDQGRLHPHANNSYDLGTSSLRWRNVYTNDLNLSNEGGSNDVDGTWGSYTIQEGAEDLFLVNRRNGKKYKFNLTEVS